jgi:hypothetical protein
LLPALVHRSAPTKDQNQKLVRGVVLHGGKARPLDTGDIALPWGWMVPKSQ